MTKAFDEFFSSFSLTCEFCWLFDEFFLLLNKSIKSSEAIHDTHTDFLNQAKFDAYGLSHHRYFWSQVKSFWNNLKRKLKIEKKHNLFFLFTSLFTLPTPVSKSRQKKDFEHYFLKFFSFNFLSLLDFTHVNNKRKINSSKNSWKCWRQFFLSIRFVSF